MTNYEKSAMAMAEYYAERVEQLLLDGKVKQAEAELITGVNHIRGTFAGLASKMALYLLVDYYSAVKAGKEQSI